MTKKSPKEILQIAEDAPDKKRLEVVNGDAPVGELIEKLRADLGSADAGVESTEEDPIQEDPRLAVFKEQFHALPDHRKGHETWQEVLSKAGPVDSLLERVNKLESPQLIRVSLRQLTFCDGGDEVPDFTLGKDYTTCRNEAHANGLKLFQKHEYRGLQQMSSRKYEKNTMTWIEAGPLASDNNNRTGISHPRTACWRYRDEWEMAGYFEYDFLADEKRENCGARRQLKFELSPSS